MCRCLPGAPSFGATSQTPGPEPDRPPACTRPPSPHVLPGALPSPCPDSGKDRTARPLRQDGAQAARRSVSSSPASGCAGAWTDPRSDHTYLSLVTTPKPLPKGEHRPRLHNRHWTERRVSSRRAHDFTPPPHALTRLPFLDTLPHPKYEASTPPCSESRLRKFLPVTSLLAANQVSLVRPLSWCGLRV